MSENDPLLPHGGRTVRYTDVEEQEQEQEEQKEEPWKLRACCWCVVLVLVFALGIAIGAGVSVGVVMLSSQGEELVKQSVEMDITHLKLADVGLKGIGVRVQGMSTVNYDGMESVYFQKVFTVGGMMLRSATLDVGSVDLETEVDGKKIKIGKVDIPPLTVSIANKLHTMIDTVVYIHPDTSHVWNIVKGLLKNPESVFSIYGSTKLYIKLGYIPIGSFNIDFTQVVTPGEYFYFNGDDVDIQNLSVKEIGNTYGIDFTLSLPNPFEKKLFAFHISQLGWQVMVNDCFQKPKIPLIDHVIVSHPFRLSPSDEYLNVNISTALTHIPDQLTENCSFDDDSTPMSVLVDQFVNNKSLPVMIENVRGSKEYPGFINELLKNMDLNFQYQSNFNTSNLIHNVSLDHLAFEFQDGDMDRPIINGDLNLFMKFPLTGLHNFKVNKIKGLPELFHKEKLFGIIDLHEWHECFNEFVHEDDDVEYLHVRFTLSDESIKIKNPEVFGEVINEVMMKGHTRIYINALLDCLIDTLVGEFEIDKIHAHSESDITKDFLPMMIS